MAHCYAGFAARLHNLHENHTILDVPAGGQIEVAEVQGWHCVRFSWNTQYHRTKSLKPELFGGGKNAGLPHESTVLPCSSRTSKNHPQYICVPSTRSSLSTMETHGYVSNLTVPFEAILFSQALPSLWGLISYLPGA